MPPAYRGPAQARAEASRPRVLVAGAGCTGALAAALLRRSCGDRLDISVWEWGRGPAGRMSSFWHEVGGGQRALADMGAQCISLRSAERLPPWLAPLLAPAEPAGLGRTAERRGGEGGWCHFHAADGLPALQHASLAEARPEERRFESRVVELTPVTTDGRPSWRVGYAAKGRRAVSWEEFDLVIFAGTARDAEGLDGLRCALSPAQQRALAGVSYDHRLCVGLVLRPELGARLEALCEGRAELAPDDQAGGCLSLLARQEAKGRTFGKQASVVVLHSTPQFAARNLQAAKQANRSPGELGRQALVEHLAGMLDLPVRELEAAVMDSKTVHWRQCQVRRPYPQGVGAGSCLVAAAAPNLVLSGDYLAPPETAGSFEGCLESAEAAAAAARSLLLGEEGPCAAASGPVRRWAAAQGDEAPAAAAKARARRWQRKTEASGGDGYPAG